MDRFPVTTSHRKPGLSHAPEKADGCRRRRQQRRLARPAVLVCSGDGRDSASAGSDALTGHLRLPHAKKAFACCWQGCGSAFARSTDLKRHLCIHAGHKTFVCSWESCTQAFKRSDEFTRHLRTHTANKPFVCPHEGCRQAFVRSGQLTIHLRRHSEEKVFFCLFEGCGYATVQLSALTKHVRVHTGERPFVCPYNGCGHAAAQSSSLRKHLRVHAEGQPFVCSYKGCGQGFACSGRLSRHLCTHAGAQPIVCLRQGYVNLSGTSSLAGEDAPSHGERLLRSRRAQILTRVPGPPEPGFSMDKEPLHPAPVVAAACSGEPASGGPPVASDRPGTAASRADPLLAWSSMPLAGAQQSIPGGPLLSSWLPPVVPPGRIQREPALEAVTPDWLTWCADDYLARSVPLLHSTQGSDQEGCALLLADDDRAFWQALLSPAVNDGRRSEP